MERFFSTAGPIKTDLHAPRQTGKTSALLAVEARLNREGRYLALYVNVEMAQAARSFAC